MTADDGQRETPGAVVSEKQSTNTGRMQWSRPALTKRCSTDTRGKIYTPTETTSYGYSGGPS